MKVMLMFTSQVDYEHQQLSTIAQAQFVACLTCWFISHIMSSVVDWVNHCLCMCVYFIPPDDQVRRLIKFENDQCVLNQQTKLERLKALIHVLILLHFQSCIVLKYTVNMLKTNYKGHYSHQTSQLNSPANPDVD